MNLALFQRQWLVVVIIFLVTIATSFLIFKTRPKAIVEKKEETIRTVTVSTPKSQKIQVPIYTQGLVEPRMNIKLQSEVSGKVISASSKWKNGGFFRKGEQLLKIEDFMYENQLAKAKAAQAQASSALKIEEGMSYVARQEWEKRNPDDDNSAARSLALREPQLEAMRAQYEAATAEVVAAENALEKTSITAPFDGVVVSKMIDVGQFVSTGLALAELKAIDVAEVRVPLTEAQQEFLNLPALNETVRMPATVKYVSQSETEIWEGTFVRTEGVLDPITKVLNGVVQIKDPYGLNKKVKKPLLLGSFVEVEINGKEINNVYVLPQRILYTGNLVWLVNSENQLESRKVKILPIRDENIYVYEGLKDNDKLVVGALVEALDGVTVHVEEKKDGFDAEEAAK